MLPVFILFLFNPQYTEGHPSDQDEQKTVEELVTYYANQYGVNQELAHYIAKNESHYGENQNDGDMDITCLYKSSPHYGQPVRARGVYQITQCYHWNVSDQQAYDVHYNISYAMALIAKGEKTCRQQFSTCDDFYKS